MKKILKVTIISLVSLILIVGVTALILFLNFKKPEVLATDTVMRVTEDGKLLVNAGLKVRNDNSYSIQVDSLSYLMQINGKTYLAGSKDSSLVLKAHENSEVHLPFVVDAKTMDKDFKNQESAKAHFIIDAYISVWGIKKVHIHIPVDKKIDLFKSPVLLADHNYIRVDENGVAHIDLVVKMVNPNKTGLKLDSILYALNIEDENYLKSQKLKSLDLKPQDTQLVHIPMVFKLKKFMKAFKGRDSAIGEFNISLLVSTPDIKQLHVDLKVKMKMPLVTDFDVGVEKVKINKLGFNNSDITAFVKIGNPNPVNLNLDHLHYILKVDGYQWADGNYQKQIILKRKSSVNLQFPIHLDTKKIAKSAGDYLKGDKVQNYEIAADFNVKIPDPNLKSIKMSVKNAGVLHLSKLIGRNSL